MMKMTTNGKTLTNTQPKVALALIAGDGTQDDLQQCLDSAAPFIDGVFIAFNGTGSLARVEERHRALWPNVPITVKHYEWEDNFATARNQSFAMVPKDEYRFILWLDSDDILINGAALRDMIARLPENAQAVFLKYEYGYDYVNDVPLVEQWRERLMRTDVEWRWRYPIHEVCHGRPGLVLARRNEVWVRHRRREGQRNEEVRARNRRILVKARKEDPREARFVYYLANEVYAEAHMSTDQDEEQRENLFRSAIKMYSDFIGVSKWNDDTYMANTNMADCYRAIGDNNKAIDVDLQGVKLHPTWPNAYVGICKACMNLGDWERMRFWATVCIDHAKKPETSQVHEVPNDGFLPYLLRGIAFEEMAAQQTGMERQRFIQAAAGDYQQALTFAPYEDSVQARLDGLGKAPQKPQEPPVGAVKLRAPIRSIQAQNGRIAFVTRTLFEPWHPALEAQHGAGGAETCIMRLAPLFAKDGWDVQVFGTPGPHAGTDGDGVEWLECDAYDTSEPYDVVISSRVPEMFDAEINARQKILWCHDVNVGPDFQFGQWGDRLHDVTIVGLSKWHIAHMSRLYEMPIDRFTIVPNGIDPERFNNGLTNNGRRMDRFVWTSSPDRGIDVALTMWPKIKDRHPDATLDIYYGWTSIDKIIAHGDLKAIGSGAWGLARFKASVMDLYDEIGGDDSGVQWHNRVPQDELARAYMGAGVWMYPSYFLETFCISAIETQMAGVIPITTHAGALPETVALRENLISGHPNNHTYQRQYIDLVDRVLQAPEEAQEAMRARGKEHASRFTWDAAYDAWTNLIER